ncbi:hypothetical protein GF325_01835 [Candidatus Bathyarchaeota archaeon]|nr:hypothetical protein [Candidatus Bathyarchaeota archaeon]
MYTYGPFSSRRLGLSLGINLLGQSKICTMDCVYCEIGRTARENLVDINYRYDPGVDMEKFKEEIERPLRHLPEIDSATIGYMGETTLASHLEPCLTIIRTVKNSINRQDGGPRITIFTNATTLEDRCIREALCQCDLVIVKLDCATGPLFSKINRPHQSVPPVNEIIENIQQLRNEMECGCRLALQTLILSSRDSSIPKNTQLNHLNELVMAYNNIKPDFVQLYTIAREPAEKSVIAVQRDERKRIGEFLQIRDDDSIEIKVY